jgi:hypothetical protein
MKRFLLPIAVIFTSSVVAQSITAEKFSLNWIPGEIVFKTGDTLHCRLRFNQAGDKPILQLTEANQTVTVPVKDVTQFSFFDTAKNRNRIFTAFKNPQVAGREFYMEKIYADRNFSILNHKTMEVPPELNFSRFVGKPIKTYKKYLLNESTGELLPLSRENLLELLEPKKVEILSYVKARNIRFKRIADFINVFEYHNSL